MNVPQDSFQDTVGTNLGSHSLTAIDSPYTALGGIAWTYNSGNTGVQVVAANGYARGTQTAIGSVSVLPTASCANYTIRGSMLWKGTTGGTCFTGVAFRYSSTASTGYLFYVDADTSTYVLRRDVAGSSTNFAAGLALPASMTAGTEYVYEINVSGPSTLTDEVSIAIKWQGQLLGAGVWRDTTTGSYQIGPGRVGMLLYGASTASVGLWMGPISVTYPYAAATGNDLNVGYPGDSITKGYPDTICGSRATYAQRKLAWGPGGLIRNVGVLDFGIAGTASADWISGASQYIAYAAAATTASASHSSLMIGVNDSKTGTATTAATYKSNLQSFITAEVAAGRKIILHYPTWVSPTGSFNATSLTLLQSYGTKIDELVAADPAHVFAGSKLTYSFIRDRASYLGDGVHPNDTGYIGLYQLTGEADRLAILADAYTRPHPVRGRLGNP